MVGAIENAVGHADYGGRHRHSGFRTGHQHHTLPADVIKTFGDQTITAAQGVAGLLGTVLIYGRLKADTALTLRKG